MLLSIGQGDEIEKAHPARLLRRTRHNGVGTASASATTINPKGAFAPLTGLATLNIINGSNHSANLKVTCLNSIMPGTVNADSTITGGKPTFASCTSSLAGAASEAAEVTALEPVHYSMLLGSNGVSMSITKINLNVFLPQRRCGMNYAGSATASTPGSAPVTVTKLPLTGVWHLTGFKGPSPFCEELFQNFREAQFSSTYDLSPPLVFTN